MNFTSGLFMKSALGPRSNGTAFTSINVLANYNWTVSVLRVRIIDSENGSAPPPVLVSRARYEVDEGFAGFQADERPTLTRRVEAEGPDAHHYHYSALRTFGTYGLPHLLP